jgi:hypothetical protein
MKQLTGTDAKHLDAAQAWLRLSNALEADKEQTSLRSEESTA